MIALEFFKNSELLYKIPLSAPIYIALTVCIGFPHVWHT